LILYRLAIVSTLLFCAHASAQENTESAKPDLIRKALLEAPISPEKPISNVEIQEITLPPNRKGKLHLHPVPVFNVIKEGAITYQIEGEEAQHLKAGDVFYEPANVRISRIDNEGDTPAKLVSLFLKGKDDHELNRLLPK
jgi:quercetin dioxygenase-like cupin family protein